MNATATATATIAAADACDFCNVREALYWNDDLGGSTCEECDLAAENA